MGIIKASYSLGHRLVSIFCPGCMVWRILACACEHFLTDTWTLRQSRRHASQKPAQNHPCQGKARRWGRGAGWGSVMFRKGNSSQTCAEFQSTSQVGFLENVVMRLMCQKRPGFQKSLLQALLLPLHRAKPGLSVLE